MINAFMEENVESNGIITNIDDFGTRIINEDEKEKIIDNSIV